ncbi:MAG: ribonuclease E/G [Lachnospiraceae bacterium]|nr:ribonuclease E/G [Lachnospiraceae bacterium]
MKLVDDYRLLLRFGVHWNTFSKLYSAIPQYLWDVRDCFDTDIDEIKTDDEDIFKEMREFMSETNKEELDKITLYTDESISLDKLYGISNKLKKATEKNVWLDSGGYIVIEPTEALVSVDVNTGKAVSRKTNPEETFLKINKEAAVMIAKQIKLRNLSGMILVDFIDMKSEEHKKELIDVFINELHKDRIHTTFVDMTKLGLVEITRKKVKKPLHEQIGMIR